MRTRKAEFSFDDGGPREIDYAGRLLSGRCGHGLIRREPALLWDGSEVTGGLRFGFGLWPGCVESAFLHLSVPFTDQVVRVNRHGQEDRTASADDDRGQSLPAPGEQKHGASKDQHSTELEQSQSIPSVPFQTRCGERICFDRVGL